MKKISVVVPCYNEEENVVPMANAIREVFKNDLSAYKYEIIFIDHDSKDRTRDSSSNGSIPHREKCAVFK